MQPGRRGGAGRAVGSTAFWLILKLKVLLAYVARSAVAHAPNWCAGPPAVPIWGMGGVSQNAGRGLRRAFGKNVIFIRKIGLIG